jgi:hypothetical protein
MNPMKAIAWKATGNAGDMRIQRTGFHDRMSYFTCDIFIVVVTAP